jgi:hypothetical protein
MSKRDSTIATLTFEEPVGEKQKISGVVVGLFLGFNAAGEPLVDYPGSPTASATVARSATSLCEADRGREAALLFEESDPSRPLVVGLIHCPAGASELRVVTRDDERVVLRAEREIVLECGKASITLTRAGKVLIRGTYVLSRSSGVNMVRGGIVHVN